MADEKKLYKSRYIIYVPYRKENKYILVHGITGAVDIVQPQVVRYLKKIREVNNTINNFPDISLETINHLKERGYLTIKTPDEEEAYFYQFGEILHKQRRSRGSTFFICPTYKCQLRCSYCYESWMYKEIQDQLTSKMSQETVDAAFAAIQKIQPDPTKIKEITLFGGEPLLGENIDIVSYILKQCYDKGYFHIWAITNGVELDKYLHLLGREPGKIERLQITLDGPPNKHDKRRYWPNGKGTFHTIVANISKALKTDATVTVRTNVDQTNLDDIGWLASFYNKKGWSKKPNFGAYCQIVFYTKRKGANLAISRLKLANTIEQKRREHPNIKFMHGSFGVHRTFMELLEKGPLHTLNPTFCGASNDMYVFDSIGNIYVCTEAMGEKSACVGSFYPNFILYKNTLDQFRNRTVMNIPTCRKCPWALLCGGGCMQHAKEVKSNYYTNFCANYQSLFIKEAPNIYERWLKKINGDKVEGHEIPKHPTCTFYCQSQVCD